MGRRRHEADAFWVWVGALVLHFCPRRPKRTWTDEMSRPVGVALSLALMEDQKMKLKHTHTTMCFFNAGVRFDIHEVETTVLVDKRGRLVPMQLGVMFT